MSTNTPSIIPKIVATLETASQPSEPWCQGTILTAGIGLEIAGVGPVDLPLRPAGARRLSDVARPAPYGKRTETIIDTKVRDTLEIDANDVEYSSEFAGAIRAAIVDAATQLQLDCERLQAELYKLLIYTKGGFFLPHRDSEKRRGMVATMIVELPSRFGGGDLIVQQGGRRKVFSFNKTGQQSAQYVAFFADCEHEVKKVTSGVRVCLAFNLILKPARKSGGGASSSQVDPKLQRAVNEWLRHRGSDPLVFALEHQYTKTGLKPDLLKGADRELHRHVAAVCRSSDCLLHFGQVSRHLCQGADDGSFGYGRRGRRRWSGDYNDLELGEVYEDEIIIDGWRNAGGKQMRLASLGCDSSQIISATPVEQWVPTQQDYEGYTGNAGNTLDRWYHKAAIVIWPRTAQFEIVAQMSLEFAIEQLLEMRQRLPGIDEDNELQQARDDCRQLAEAIIQYWPNRIYDYHSIDFNAFPFLQKFARELPKFDDPALLGVFLRTVAERDWQVKLDHTVLTSLKRMGVADVLPHLQHLIEFEPPPNQYGIRFLEGLAERDASWLLKLVCDRKRGGLNPEQVEQLIGSATKKLVAYARCEATDHHRRSAPPAVPWRTLCKATIAVESRTLSSLLELATECEQLFDLRQVQVAAAVELRNFALKQLGECPASLQKWIDRLRAELGQATSSQPQVPSDFIRPSETGCNCSYCAQLSEFLLDPANECTKIAAREDRRQHLERVIRSRQLDVATKLVRSGSPFSLQCTKTAASYERDLKQYQTDLKLLASLE
ncbi:MAG: 2OG-Fe(II) oxygenase [Pirellulales bacterium]